MLTIEHLREAWEYALVEIGAAIFYLESGENFICPNEISQQVIDAWLNKLQHDRMEYSALLTAYPSIH